ncbi:nicotinamide riboside kinase [Trichomonascus vanleenenianus]|uniref:ribosylnicotinamide kinase n=1 Tax=Trichomonascus vanleenenianus TaxID=2268995 RepID=UPI003ECA8D98
MTKGIDKIIGISGPSSSGKSTLTRLLKRVFPNAVILYQDDFYYPDNQIPVDRNGLQDWDCPEAFDLEYMREVLAHVHSSGTLPEKFVSIEEQNSVGPSRINEEDLNEIVGRVAPELRKAKLLLVDGIMLYNKGSPLANSFDMKLFIRGKYEDLKRRREARDGYVTVDSFWVDPPGYFDDIVWPAYIKTHKHLFEDEDVTKDLGPTAAKLQIHSPDVPNPTIPELLKWSIDMISLVVSAGH